MSKFPSPPVRTPFRMNFGIPSGAQPGVQSERTSVIRSAPESGSTSSGGQQMPSWPWLRWFQQLASRMDNPVLPLSTPASSTAAGTTGTITYDANYVYVCVAPSSWKRVALTSF